jgi:hypothetical protein
MRTFHMRQVLAVQHGEVCLACSCSQEPLWCSVRLVSVDAGCLLVQRYGPLIVFASLHSAASDTRRQRTTAGRALCCQFLLSCPAMHDESGPCAVGLLVCRVARLAGFSLHKADCVLWEAGSSSMVECSCDFTPV